MELSPEESVACQVEETLLRVGRKDADRGSLFVTNSRVLWKGERKQFSLLYTQIVLHALSSDTHAFSRPCLYCQVKGGALPEDVGEGNAESGEDPSQVSSEAETAEEVAEDLDSMVEVIFLPDDASVLPKLFSAMSEMAALHPDANCEDLDDDQDDLLDLDSLRARGWTETGEARTNDEEGEQ